VRADGILKGKRLRTTGKVREVKRDIAGKMYAIVGTGGRLEVPALQCFFTEDHVEEVTALRAGAPVMVDGTIRGLTLNVLADDCAVPHCARDVCDALKAAGVAGECKQEDGIDLASFPVPLAGRPKDAAVAFVECFGNQKEYDASLSGRGDAGIPETTIASRSARIFVRLLGNVPADVIATAKGVFGPSDEVAP
jgi:hypothetical protein